MAATHLTLEEAAERLGLTPDGFKKRLKTDAAFKTLVPIRDGPNLRFKATAIEELARQLGVSSDSDPDLPLSPLEEPPPDSDDFKIPTTEAKKDTKKKPEEPLLMDSSEEDIFSLAPDEPKAEAKKPTKSGGDSDVRLEAGKSKKGKKDGSDEAVVPTEELSIDFSGPGSAVIKGGSSAKLSAPKSSGKIPKPDSGKALNKPPSGGDSSEFELSLDADSSDFELKLNTDASDEVDLGEMPKDATGSSGKRGGASGINLRDPADSGISLEKGKGKPDSGKAPDSGKHKPDSGKALGSGKPKEKEEKPKAKAPAPPLAPASDSSESDVDFELTLDSSAAASGLKLGGLKYGKLDADSDSEFELTLDDSGDSSLEGAASDSAEAEKRDIFETDFEIPPMDESGSEAVALESDTDLEKSDSDFEVEVGDSDVPAEDASGSEVVLLEDEGEAPTPKAKKKPASKKAPVEDEGDVDLADVDLDDEEDASTSKALKGLKKPHKDDDDETEEEGAPATVGVYRPVPWGPIPALFLLPCLAIVLVGSLLGFELLQTMWGYQQPRKPAAPLVREIAKSLDMEIKDQ